MKIAVCIKQVPTREWQPRIDETRRGVREQDASFEMNEPDAYALEEALRLREKHGGEVVVCTAGPARASQVLREALARGRRSGDCVYDRQSDAGEDPCDSRASITVDRLLRELDGRARASMAAPALRETLQISSMLQRPAQCPTMSSGRG
jgi:electron transfer flavoprotein alpha/beta subunit